LTTPFDLDVERASDAGADAARAARKRFEGEGIPRDELRLCEAEGTEGAELPHCLKAYLPPPAGRFGMVFQLEIVTGHGQLRYTLSVSASSPRVERRKRLRSRAPAPSRLANRSAKGRLRMRGLSGIFQDISIDASSWLVTILWIAARRM
jgi:hypothetical protein